MLSGLFRKAPTPTAPAAPGPKDTAAPASAPPVVEADGSTDAAAWTARHRDALRDLVAEHGALTVRGLGLRTPSDVEAVLHRLANRPATEREAFAARDTYAPGVYSSSTWPPNQPMCMHHEVSYTTRCPGLLLFACLRPATRGGALAVADAAAVLRALDPALVDRFEREGWLLTRAYNDEIGATLAQSFGTEARDAVEAYCRDHAVDCSWHPDGSLHTRQHRAAVLRHPVSGRRCWFNQVAFLNEWTMAPNVRDFLVDEYGPDGLPFNTRHGNGDPVLPDVVEHINQVYEAHSVHVPWNTGDLMVVDNLRTAHSRGAYEGPREVVVAMGDPVPLGPARSDSTATRPGRAAA